MMSGYKCAFIYFLFLLIYLIVFLFIFSLHFEGCFDFVCLFVGQQDLQKLHNRFP